MKNSNFTDQHDRWHKWSRNWYTHPELKGSVTVSSSSDSIFCFQCNVLPIIVCPFGHCIVYPSSIYEFTMGW